jgi:FkbM family methyltransferase
MTDEEQESLYLNAGRSDEYKFRRIGFVPDTVYDIGADCGSVTMFVQSLFPNAKIVAVEPNPWSFPRLAKNSACFPLIVPVNAAVGTGPMFEPPTCESPLQWLVVDSSAAAYDETWPVSKVPSVTLAELYAQHGGERYAVKVDCETAEVGIMRHAASRQVLLNSSYFAAELHFWGRTHELMMEAVDTINRFLFELAQTHTLYTYSYGACGHVWAKRRVPLESVEAWLG